jgi:RNA polymerase sigma-70 factor, ECF subfamily
MKLWVPNCFGMHYFRNRRCIWIKTFQTFSLPVTNAVQTEANSVEEQFVVQRTGTLPQTPRKHHSQKRNFCSPKWPIERISPFVIQNALQDRIPPVHHIYTEDSDAVLVVAVGRGQQAALAEIYRRHGGQSFRLAERLLLEAKLAEDVVQDVFLQLWRDPESFDAERASLRTWLLLKTHGKAVDTVRAEAARRGREERLLNDRTNNELDLDREIWDLNVADRVQQAIGQLPESERQVITLAYFGGRTYTEVAEALGQPEGTVKSRIRKGLTSLRRSLGDLRFDGERTEHAERNAYPRSHDDSDSLTNCAATNTSNSGNKSSSSTSEEKSNGTLSNVGQWNSGENTHLPSGFPGTSKKGDKQS